MQSHPRAQINHDGEKLQSCGEAVKLDLANANSYLVKVFFVGVKMKISENTTGISCTSLVPSAEQIYLGCNQLA